MLLINLVALVSGYLQYELLKNAADGGGIPMDEATSNDQREQIIAIISVLLFIAGTVYFIMWFRRAYYNLWQLVPYLSFSEGWAAGAWFVPFINLVRPYRIMKELYVETSNILRKNGHLDEDALSTKYLGLWWALYLIVVTGDQIISKLTIKADTIDDLLIATQLGMIGNVIAIPFCLITIKVIRDYSKIEPLLSLEMVGEDSIEGIGERNELDYD
ncbi:MAG: DUF4328 domain-containing protein [Saprospiraceae bacterium]